MNRLRRSTRGIILCFALVLTACGGGGGGGSNSGGNSGNTTPTPTPAPTPTPEPVAATFEVKVANTTAAQPLSPPAVLLHDSTLVAWQVGASASEALEVLAEDGDPGEFVALDGVIDSVAGSVIIEPGSSITVTVEGELDDLFLTVASMLVNTNDGFTGTAGLYVGMLEVGQSEELLAPIYDAGTEANTETDATIPGPAAWGEGFNAARDDVGFVAHHPGVVTQADGLTESALEGIHRFDNGAMLITVTRTQ